MLFADRYDAGVQLAGVLREYEGGNGIILGLPRGGVIVGAAIASRLSLPLTVFVAAKIGAPDNPEYAIGAVAETGEISLNQEVVAVYGVTREYIEQAASRERREIARRIALYRGGEPLPDLAERTAILVDDGVATGYTMFAAAKALRARRVGALVVAVPVGPAETISILRHEADRVVCLATPEPFFAVGRFYRDFHQVSDEEVVQALRT